MIDQVLTNLVDNAIKYPDRVEGEVAVDERAGDILFEVVGYGGLVSPKKI
jgi:signal transduction histidine kinase